MLDYTLKCQRFNDMSDRDLVDAIIKGEEDAVICLLHHRLSKYFKHLSKTYTRLQYSADDIANEMYIFLSMDNWKKLRLFKFKSPLVDWIMTVAYKYLQNEINKYYPLEHTDVLYCPNIL